MNLQEAGKQTPQADPGAPVTLESWKEIAAYLQRDAKTARKWEKEEGLPIHRHAHTSRSSVYAYPGEIDRWRATRKVVPEPVARPLWKTPAFAATMLLCLVMVGNGVRPQSAEAEQGQIRTLICSGANCDGTISPDGKSMAIQLPKGGIGIRDLATNRIRAVVEPDAGTESIPALFSPDGSRIAYVRAPKELGNDIKQAPEATETVVVNTNGTGSRSVARGSGFAAAWSPDGKRLLMAQLTDLTSFTSLTANLAWLNLADGANQKLPASYAGLSAAVVSPDGKYVAFNASKDANAERNVYIMASDGSGEAVVSPSAAYQEPIAWTPDGKHLVFAQFGASVSLRAAQVANGKVQGPVIDTHTEFEKSVRVLGMDRSGAVYYRTVSSGSDIYTALLDAATGRVTSAPIPVPVPGGSAGKIVLPRWSPDSRQLAYMHLGPPREMYIFSFDTGKEQRIAPDAEASSAEHCWSRDGSSVFLRSGSQSVRFNLTPAQMTPMFPELKQFNLANCMGDVVLGRTDSGGIKVRSLRDGMEKEIYHREPNAGALTPVLSHDAGSVAFVTPGTYVASTGRSVIHLVSSNGGPVRDLAGVNSPAQIQPYWGVAWSADDRFVYFAQRADDKSAYELMRVPAAGGAAESMGLKLEDLRDLDIAPDGTRIAFSIGAVNRPEIWAIRGFLPSKN